MNGSITRKFPVLITTKKHKMGVRGLKTFIENNPDLVADFKLENSHLIIDANNIKSMILTNTHYGDRADLFGGDFIRFAEKIKVFLNNLMKANVIPIFVYDGAKDTETHDKTSEQLRRSLRIFDQIVSINRYGFGDLIMPMNTSIIFSSIVIDYGCRIVACMFEADNEIARLSNHYKGPILSNDSDFFLMDLDYGVISFDTGDFLKNDDRNVNRASVDPIRCRLFTQKRFVQMFPGLSKSCLPLLGVLAGNDYVTEEKFEQILNQLPSNIIRENAGLTTKQFKQKLPFSHQRILKVLYFLCDKTLNEAVNQICAKFMKDKRNTIKEFINRNRKFYDIPAENQFNDSLKKLTSKGGRKFFKTEVEFNTNVEELAKYLITCLEKHALTFRVLEIMHRNVMFLTPNIEDYSQPRSSRVCLTRILRVLLRLLRTHEDECKPLVMYDRVATRYEKRIIKQLDGLEEFGTIDYVIYDLVSMTHDARLDLLLSTFHCSIEEFDSGISAYCQYFDYSNAQQAFCIKLILDYICIEEPGKKLSKRFMHAIFTTFTYYLSKTDEVYNELCQSSDRLQGSAFNINRYHLTRPPCGTRYDMRIMHQLSQFTTIIHGFSMLNSLLSEPIPRLIIYDWLNACLIYNLTDKVEKSTKALHRHDKAKIAFD